MTQIHIFGQLVQGTKGTYVEESIPQFYVTVDKILENSRQSNIFNTLRMA